MICKYSSINILSLACRFCTKPSPLSHHYEIRSLTSIHFRQALDLVANQYLQFNPATHSASPPLTLTAEDWKLEFYPSFDQALQKQRLFGVFPRGKEALAGVATFQTTEDFLTCESPTTINPNTQAYSAMGAYKYSQMVGRMEDFCKEIGVGKEQILMGDCLIAVDKAHQRNGVGGYLMSFLEQLALKSGYKIILSFNANGRSRRICEKQGFHLLLEIDARAFQFNRAFPFQNIEEKHRFPSVYYKLIG